MQPVSKWLTMSSIMRKQVDNVNHVDSAPASASAEAVIELVHG